MNYDMEDKEYRIVFIDEDRDFLSETAEILEDSGFHVVPVDEVSRSVSEMKTVLPNLVVLELETHSYPIERFLRDLKKDSEILQIPFIFIKSHDEDEHCIKNELENFNVFAFFTKPFHMGEFISCIKNACKSGKRRLS